MFNRLKSYDGSGSYLISKKDDTIKKATNSTPISPPPPLSISRTISTSSSSSSANSPTSSPSIGRQQGLTNLLTCPVCFEDYQTDGLSGREPLFLICHHSICRTCLPKLAKPSSLGKHGGFTKEGNELTCPECRTITQIPPTGLTQNFYLVSLIETRDKKLKEPSSRLRMWCGDCHDIARETCTTHQVIHLSPILADYANTYLSSKKQLLKYLNKRAKHKGEEAREIKESIDQLDSATTSLRRRLVAQLDHSTLAQAKANSLLQEVEQMCRRVGLEEAIGNPRRKSSADGFGNEVMSSLLKENFFQETRSTHEGSLRDDFQPRDDSGRRNDKSHHRRSHSTDDTLNSSPCSSSSSRSSPTFERQISFDHLSSHEQEAKLLLLKECLSSMDNIQETLWKDEKTTKEKMAKIKSQGEHLPKETLIDMFNRAMKVLQ